MITRFFEKGLPRSSRTKETCCFWLKPRAVAKLCSDFVNTGLTSR